VNRRLVLVHDSQPKRRVRATTLVDWDVVWLREMQEMELFYDERPDIEHESTIRYQDCEVSFSALGISGNVKDKELDVTFRRVGEREPGTLIFTEEMSWIEIYVEDYALGVVVTAYDKGQRLDMPLGLWFTGERDDYQWYLGLRHLSYERERPLGVL
jgi:hypothetical protein